MGGSNRDPYPVRGGGAGGDERACGQIRFSTVLQQPVTVPAHAVDDVFELVRHTSGGADVIAAVDDDGTIIGTVIEELPDLLRCTAQGWVYVADVVSVAMGVHTVRVRAADRVAVTTRAYAASPAAIAGNAPVELVGDGSGLPADLQTGSTLFRRTGISELRGLVRAGVQFIGAVDAGGSITVRFADDS